jgi:uncharacterized protein
VSWTNGTTLLWQLSQPIWPQQGVQCHCRDIGGFREWPLLEDVELTERLRKLSSPVVVPRSVIVSARRWDRLGLLQTFLLNQYILCAWRCGIPPDKLAQIYSSRCCK